MIHSAYMSGRNAYILRAYCYGLGSNDCVSCDCEREEKKRSHHYLVVTLAIACNSIHIIAC